MATVKGKIRLLIAISLGVSTFACIQAGQYGVRRVYRETAKGVRSDLIEAQPLRGDLTAYGRLAVEPLQNQMEDQIPTELVASINEELFKQVSQVKRLKVVRADSPVERSAAFPTSPGADQAAAVPPADAAPSAFQPQLTRVPAKPAMPSSGAAPAAPGVRTVILRGAIVDFDRGDNGLRVLQIGVGRESVLTLDLWLVDAATGQVLAKYVAESEVFRVKGKENDMVFSVSKGVGKLMMDLTEKKNSGSARVSPKSAKKGR